MLGIAALINRLKQKVSVTVIYSICCLSVIWNILLILQYALRTVPRYGPTDMLELVKNQFLIIPLNFWRLLEAWLTRN
jgi:ABC-type anion transport system duplicated permease subunit